jgi:toxin FitB
MMIILDTNVISALMRAHPFPQVVAWVAKVDAAELATTTISEAEILYGIEIIRKASVGTACLQLLRPC